MGLDGVEIDKRSIRPSSRLVSLFSREKKRAHWLRFKKETGLRHVPSPNSFFERRFAPNTVREIVEILVAKNRQPIVDPYPFSKKDVREAIRRITTEITGITDFSDADKFVQDLGID